MRLKKHDGNTINALWRSNWEGNQKRGAICACIADSPFYIVGTNTTLQNDYSNKH